MSWENHENDKTEVLPTGELPMTPQSLSFPTHSPALEAELLEVLAGLLSIEDSVTQGQESERRAYWLPKARAVLARSTK